jgi:WS/DGAT/MGAT family acyltransferase
MQLGGLDNLMIGGEIPNIPMHIAAAMLYEGSGVDSGHHLFEQMQETLSKIIENHLPILRCRIEEMPFRIDKAYWVDDEDFDLTYHISRVALPEPHDWQEFYRLFGQFHAQPLDQKKPLWHFTLVEGLDAMDGVPSGSFALFCKIHHALMDGKSGMRLLRSLHSLGPGADAAPLADSLPLVDAASEGFSAPPWWMKYGRAWWNSIERPVDLAGTLVKLLPQVWQGREPGEKEQDKEAAIPRIRFNHPVAADRVVGHVRMGVAELEKLEEKYQCTKNDLALCTVAGALRHFLGKKGELPAEDLVAAMPIDIRKNHEDGDMGNQVSLARVHLHTDIKGVKSRLKAIQAATGHSKEHSRKGNPHALLDLVDEIHPALIIWLGQWLIDSGRLDRMTPLVNTVITNVPGIRSEAYLAGARLVDYLGFGPLAPNVGLFHTVSSTPEHVNISFASTREFVGDGSEYRASLERSYAELVRKLA